MYNNKKTMLLLSTAVLSGFALNADAANWRLVPSITVTETYTDNVDLDTTFQESGFITQIAPNFSLTGNGARLNASINYTANYFYYPGNSTDEHDLRHNLQTSLSSELISETFFIDGSANINQQFLDRRRAISTEQVSRTDNRRTVQTYQVSPYLVHRFGSWASAELRYDFRYIRTAADAEQTTPNTFFGNSLSHTGGLSIQSGREFSKLNWTLTGQYRTEERENSLEYKTTTARADFSYQVSHMFALLGSAGYQKRDALGSFANFSGFIWDAGFRLVPGPRTSISFRYGNQYDGETFSLDAMYKITAKNVISLTYTDRIQTFQSLAFDGTGADNLNSSLNSDFISGDITRRKQWRLSISGTRGRTSYSSSAFYSQYQSDNLALDEKRYGGSVSISRNLNRRLSIDGRFSYNLSKFLSDNINDKFWSASTNLNYQISKSLLGSLSYSHSNRDQSRFGNFNGGSNYISLSIRAVL
ncbi:MAG: TIGR03016 family PEP-CTERM system-associated outer membrane protein [Emcibacter sp.]|nr:TIGR03016 family PEP-CTERM system-associated outer membrane protein [Emcibacter sp.]